MTIADKPPPTPCTTGRPGLLCVLTGHIFKEGICSRPGCKSVEKTYQHKLDTVVKILAPRPLTYCTAFELSQMNKTAELILEALNIHK